MEEPPATRRLASDRCAKRAPRRRPLFAVLAGVGWRRTQDALGPVIRDTDGRAFTITTLAEMIDVEPFPGLRGRVGVPKE